jgi:hypothetical protein
MELLSRFFRPSFLVSSRYFLYVIFISINKKVSDSHICSKFKIHMILTYIFYFSYVVLIVHIILKYIFYTKFYISHM